MPSTMSTILSHLACAVAVWVSALIAKPIGKGGGGGVSWSFLTQASYLCILRYVQQLGDGDDCVGNDSDDEA
jgi:hypothetical protein